MFHGLRLRWFILFILFISFGSFGSFGLLNVVMANTSTVERVCQVSTVSDQPTRHPSKTSSDDRRLIIACLPKESPFHELVKDIIHHQDHS